MKHYNSRHIEDGLKPANLQVRDDGVSPFSVFTFQPLFHLHAEFAKWKVQIKISSTSNISYILYAYLLHYGLLLFPLGMHGLDKY